MTESWAADRVNKELLVSLLIRLTVYYVILFGFVIMLVKMYPAFFDMLPVGGVGELSGTAALDISQFEDAILNGDLDDTEIAAGTGQETGPTFLFEDARFLFFSMLGSLLLMLPVSWVYKAIHLDGEHDHSLDETSLVLPAVVAGIVMIVQHSLALAFSLAGIVAGVHFRRALSDTFDTLFIFVAIAVGIAAGIKALDIAVVLTLFFNYAALIVCFCGDGLESQHIAQKTRLRARQKALQKLADAEKEKLDD